MKLRPEGGCEVRLVLRRGREVVITVFSLLCHVYCVRVSTTIPRLPKFNNSPVELKLINIIIQRMLKFKFNILNTGSSLSVKVIFC